MGTRAALGWGNDSGVADIIVTAQKHEQSLQDVPISITAISSETLQANRITTVTDIANPAPNLMKRDTSGSNRIPSITMRGLNIAGMLPGQDRAISIYLDGVWLGASTGLAFELPDLERRSSRPIPFTRSMPRPFPKITPHRLAGQRR